MIKFLYKIHRVYWVLIGTLFNKFQMKVSDIYYGKNFCSCGCILFRNYGGKNGIILGDNVYINSNRIADPIGGDTKTILYSSFGGKIILNNHVSISNTTIFSAVSIEIGEGTCIGGNCKIYDTDFHSVYSDDRLHGNINVLCAPIKIGKNVFIGGHCIILKGVSIGDHSVIGAGSIVTCNVPEGEIWAGVPAKFIRRIK